MLRGICRAIAATTAILAIAWGATDAHAGQLFGYTTSAMRQHFADAPSAADVARFSEVGGAEVARLGVSWEYVQPESNGDGGAAGSRWTKVDEAVETLRARGIQPLLMIADAPYWAHKGYNCEWDHCPPDAAHLDNWASFARAVAGRYPDAAAIEVWNAPNTNAWWPVANQGPDGGHYATVYSWAARAIHRERPAMPVLLGALGYAGGKDNPGKSLSIPTFLKQFYANVNPTALLPHDGLSIHAYPSLREVEQLDGRFRATLEDARSARNRHDPDRKIWVTEVGMTTTGPFAVSPADQARGVLRAVRYMEDQPDIAGFTVFNLIESKHSEAAPQEKGYGVVKRGVGTALHPKPAFCDLARWAGNEAPIEGCPDAPGDGGGGGGDGGGGGGGGGSGGPPDPDDVTCTVVGTGGPDVLTGTAANDVICGGEGTDTIRGLAGNDTLLGQDSYDVVIGGRGRDAILGGLGRDLLRGKKKGDWIWGGRGGDTVHGGPGKDMLRGGRGQDRIRH